ncbi:Cytochrome P450 [Macleaya cordata]|uniref:Cytochrome P450 n=1 Tax=Macleaya cordata TaxID=56857 RepID=A0A200QB12_MACCD|nr:Cytochrome P450 [Macleaya cordata]
MVHDGGGGGDRGGGQWWWRWRMEMEMVMVMISKISGCSWWWSDGLVVSLLVAMLVASWYVIMRSTSNGKKLPPGPRGFPLVGNLFSLEADLHLYLAKLAQVYGPILKLQLGRKCCVVVSSSSLSKEVLRDQDATFANRDAPIAGLVSTYGGLDIGWSPKVRQTVRDLYYKIDTQGEERTSVGNEFRQVIFEIVELLGKPNVSDLFPVLRWFDIQGIERRAKTLLAWFDRIFKSVIDQRLKMDKANQTQKQSKDFLQFLLELMEQQDAKIPISMTQLKALFMDIFVAGTDTTSTTLEWTMTETMHNPEIMRKVQEELDEVVGMDNMVEESNLSKLHYLDAVVKETFRLHPVVPLAVPHCPSSSCIVGGYLVPKGARVLFNVWAIHRDPEAWDNPLVFRPERFLTDPKKYDYSGNNFNYLAFGSGRRICAGIPLAERMLRYVLASLLHSFEWRLPEGTQLDLTERFGFVLKKSTPLVAIPTPRLLNLELYN